MRWSVVVPSNREEGLKAFTSAWGPFLEKHQADLIVVWDGYDKPDGAAFGWEDFPSWVPRQTDMCRSLGILEAWRRGSEFTISLDDDVRPMYDVFLAYEREFSRGAVVSDYLSVGALTSGGVEMRGFPYAHRDRQDVAVQYGGWDGVLDYDALTQLEGVKPSARFERIVLPVPLGSLTTCCAMNMAWRTEYAPIMWQLPLYEGRYNRYGDIWSGLFQKRTLDAIGAAMLINGNANVWHHRMSDPHRNLEREKPGIPLNEILGSELQSPHESLMLDAYRCVTDQAALFFRRHDREYADHFLMARNEWLAQF